jgi:hypothetical protein
MGADHGPALGVVPRLAMIFFCNSAARCWVVASCAGVRFLAAKPPKYKAFDAQNKYTPFGGYLY